LREKEYGEKGFAVWNRLASGKKGRFFVRK
jgi:hypothetical protein